MISFISLSIILLLGYCLRLKIKLLRRLYLPSCVIAGLLGLLMVQLLGLFDGGDSPNKIALFVEDATFGWNKLPSLLINVVFACLFIGVKVPSFKKVWSRSGPQLAYGQIVAWGQYVVGVGLWIVLIQFVWKKLPAMFGGVLPVGFEGGHGTAAGLASVFAEKGWAVGADFALTSATFGILGAIIFGMILVNWAESRGYTAKHVVSPEDVMEDDSVGVIPVDRRPAAGKLTVETDAIESFALHICIVGIACLIGYLGKEVLILIENQIPAMQKMGIFRSFPLFPLCMMGGFIVQVFEEKFDSHNHIDLGLIKRIQNASLDFLVVAAIATINIKVIAAGMVPLIILVVGGILWNVFCVGFLAKRLLPDAWFERSIAEMGQSMGVTATGLLLLRVVDPDYKTPAADAFAYKQLLHEPIMGGGLWTGLAIPLLASVGAYPVFGIATGAVVIWLGVMIFVMKPGYSKG